MLPIPTTPTSQTTNTSSSAPELAATTISKKLLSTTQARKNCVLLLLSMIAWPATGFAADANACHLQVLEDLGWQITYPANALASRTTTPEVNGNRADTCRSDLFPEFQIDKSESNNRLLSRVRNALDSDTTRCLFNRSLKQSTIDATGNIIANTRFVFPEPGEDPRDPFTPPASSWLPSPRRGYDIPSDSLTDGIRSLYREPVVAECASAIQVAQLATLVEHFDSESDQFVNPADVGIGVWREFVKSPSIKANKPLLISRKRRKQALKRLAALGRGAFYNQSGYISPVNNSSEFIDSPDNRGQNFLIIDITEQAVADLKKRRRPLREVNRMTLEIWDNYNRLRATGLQMDILIELLEKELLAADSFFSDITVYIHPLRTGTFARFLARQFRYNPRTAYKFEVYEDFQTGYFFDRYIDYRLSRCEVG